MYYLIAYNSITFATRIKNYFRYDGDYVGVIHTPSGISRGTCSYSVKVKPDKLSQVLKVSAEFGFKIKGVYRQDASGDYTEVNV